MKTEDNQSQGVNGAENKGNVTNDNGSDDEEVQYLRPVAIR
eukprot:CAMPEP_0176389820 /NCGR_PEP_ID=MMETSP0126-20121128/38687_1 /TAXON_ID=141414 ORGANISM="Strombidinopsis acuminatum, Strain SPMC142" /NCGR_SAMPLE_ID=MMETSP0126 /ASSEMBLY_ACC=CAM_ASM_000229 /LENGTH=40 /DNA_ID= /DNA_START= /DNA_END= /DNA_ORIENTATION=